jgi:hypothetical protein
MTDLTSYRTGRKAKKSFTLSPDSVAFLETMREQRRAESVSAILDEILQAVRREHERRSLELAVANYYGSLSTEEVAEQADWGAFAFGEFPHEERA